MADRALRLLIVLSVVVGLVVSLGPGAAVGQPPQPTLTTSSLAEDNLLEALNGPTEVLTGDNNYFLKIDLRDPRVHPRVMLANNDSGGLQSLYAMKNRLEGYAQWIIVNGDLFSGSCPSGVNCAQGLTYIGGQRKDNWSAYGSTWMARGNVGFDSSNNVQTSVGDGQSRRHMTIGGGPRVLMSGGSPTCYGELITVGGATKTLFPASGEQFDGDARYWCSDTRPITMIGYSADGRYLYMGISQGGKTVTQLAQWLRDRGAHEILRFDSGSSSGMYYDGQFIGGTGSKAIANAFAVTVDAAPPPQPCPAPNLRDPGNGHTASSRTITFRWDDVDCDHDGFTFRVKTVPDMERDGQTVVDTGEAGTERTVTFDSQWDDRDLYWSVRAANAPGGADWAPARVFRISPNVPPSISFNTANGDSFPSGRIESRNRDWIFQGTASDPEGHLDRVEFRCSGDDCGSYHSQSGLSSWTYERHGMAGQNDVHFVAYDDEHSTDSRHLDLNIDLAPPSTGHNLAGTVGQNGWYISPVEVQLHADDGNTGNARAGVQELRYRVDGGSWQTTGGADARFTASGNGNHTVDYYAVDRVGNVESQRQATFKIDATPPTAPGATAETHGAVSGQWQKNWSDPVFTWGPASDATSGLWYYRVDWDGTLQVTTAPAYDPPAVRTGSYALRVRAVDQAGNVGPEGALFTFRYDGTPPHAPDIQNNDSVASGVWTNMVRTADFSWPVPLDEGSGIAGYNIYWGPVITGTSDTLVTAHTFVDTTPICAEDEAATYYLRVRSQDNAGWPSEWVGYALAYDGAPPTATLVANYGLTVTHQANVHLDVIAADEGSGVTHMRLSNDARTWSDWTDVVAETYWEIPAIGRRFHPIYLQVVDGTGNLSGVVSDTVYLDVNVPRPRSDNFWLWDDMMTAGGTVVTSTNYYLRSSVGQSLDSPASTSSSYVLYSGFQAGTLAAPTQTPTYTTYFQIGYVIAGGGACTPTLQSANYQIYGTLGQPAHVRTITSANYILLSGFWGGAGVDPQPPEPPKPPEPPPPPECEFYSLTINDGALFTNRPDVALGLCGPDPVEVMLSNDGGFGGATWQPYTRTVPWTLQVYGAYVLPRFVYSRYRDGEGEIHGTFFDDVIYDPNAPAGEVAFDLADLLPAGRLQSGTRPLRLASQDSAELFVSAGDDSSGLAEMQVSLSPDFEGATWEPYSAIVPLTFAEDGEQTVYVRFRDNADNVSDSSSDSLIVDTTPPAGMASVVEGVAGPDTISATVALAAFDNATGVSQARISARESLTDTLWQPYVSQVTVPISYTGELEPALYVQFRDGAGNASQVYSTTYLVDTAPPVLYVEVGGPGYAVTRTVTVLAYDELTDLGQMWLSNDPLMLDGVATMPYTTTVTWVFDERRVVWVQLADSVGNVSELYPAYAPTNTLPSLASLPDALVDHTTSLPVTLDLWAYASDAETPSDGLTYAIVGTPPAGAGVTIAGSRWLTINPSKTWCGGTDVMVRVADPEGRWDSDVFRVSVSWSCPGPVAMPGAPVLIAPVDGRTAASSTPAFAWHPVAGAEAYQVQVDDDPDFSSPEQGDTLSGTDYVPTAELSGGVYYWRVRATDDSEVGAWSEKWVFIVPTSSPLGFRLYLPIVIQ